jgi:hypothetical protein
MKRYIFAMCVGLLAVLMIGLVPALSQDDSKEGDDAAPPSQQPGPEHKWLAEDEGEWTIEAKLWMPGASEPTTMKGRSTMKMLWGRYLREEFTLGEGEQAIHGEGYIGFDNAAREFKSTYVLNTGTGMQMSAGKREGDVLTLSNEHEAPGVGKIKIRVADKRTGADSRIKEVFGAFGDQPERRMWEFTYTRKK